METKLVIELGDGNRLYEGKITWLVDGRVFTYIAMILAQNSEEAQKKLKDGFGKDFPTVPTNTIIVESVLTPLLI